MDGAANEGGMGAAGARCIAAPRMNAASASPEPDAFRRRE